MTNMRDKYSLDNYTSDVFGHLENLALCTPVFYASHYALKHPDSNVYQLIAGCVIFICGVALTVLAITDFWVKLEKYENTNAVKFLHFFVYGIFAVEFTLIAFEFYKTNKVS